MKKVLLLIFVLSLLVLPSILAQKTPQKDVAFDLKIPFVVNGSAASSSASCNISIDYPDGNYLKENVSMTNRNNGEFNITLSAVEINQLGFYEWRAFCCDGVNCAAGFDEFEVTTTGEKVSLSNIIIVIVFLVMAIFFLYLGSIFEKDKWMVKTAFYLFAILMGVLAVNSGRIIASESAGLTTMATSGFVLVIAVLSFMFLYIFINALVQVFKQLKHKKEIRWNY